MNAWLEVFDIGISKAMYNTLYKLTQELIKHNLFFINCIKRRKNCLYVKFFMWWIKHQSCKIKAKAILLHLNFFFGGDANGVLCIQWLWQNVNQKLMSWIIYYGLCLGLFSECYWWHNKNANIIITTSNNRSTVTILQFVVQFPLSDICVHGITIST